MVTRTALEALHRVFESHPDVPVYVVPQSVGVDSINVATAAAVALYEIAQA